MDDKRFRVKVGVFLVLIEQDQVLMLRRYNTGIADGSYVLPMGGKKEGETATDALIREAQEEVGVIVSPDDIEVAHTMHRLHHLPDATTFEQIDLFYVAHNYRGTPRNLEPHKCDEVAFYPLSSLPPMTEPFIKQALRCIEKGQCYSEIGWAAALA